MSETQQGVEGRLFHPELGNEAVSGVLSVNRSSLNFRSEANSEDIPLDRITVELEGKAERLCFQDSDRPGLKIFTEDLSLLDQPGVPQFGPIREQLARILTWREIMRRLRIICYFAAGCLLLVWLGSRATSAMVWSIASRVPPEWEEKEGKAEIEELQNTDQLVTDTNRVAQLRALAEPLTQTLPGGDAAFHFYLANNDDPNAFALPGGYIVVNQGLLKLADRPEQVLGVLAHEVTHVIRKHHARSIISASGPLVIFGIFLHSQSGIGNLLTEGSGIMVYEGFSQEYETEADDGGWDYLVAAKIDPHGMIEMFQKLENSDPLKKVGLKMPQAFSSHPALNKRIIRLEKKWNRLPQKSGFQELKPLPPELVPKS